MAALATAAALLAGVAAPSAVPARDPTSAEIAAFRENSSVRYDRSYGTTVEVFLFERTAAEPPGTIAARLRDEFRLPLDAARHLAVGSMLRAANWQGEPEEQVALGEAEVQLERAFALAPSSSVALEELADFYASSRRCSSADLVRIARAWGDLRDAALQLRNTLIGSGCEQPVLAALVERPDDLPLIALLAELHTPTEGPYGIAVRKYAADRFVHGPVQVGSDVAVQIERSYLASLLFAGAARSGIAEYESLPEPLRRRVWSDAEPASDRAFAPGYQEIAASERSALQIELAAAYLRTGNTDRARSLLASTAIERESLSDRSRESDPEDCAALLRALITGNARDPFALLVDVGVLEGASREANGCIHSPTWTELLARFAAQTQYVEIERYFANRESHVLSARRFRSDETTLGPRLRGAPIGIQRAISSVARTLVEPEESDDLLFPESEDDRTAVSRAIVAAAARVKGPFVEHQLPAGLGPIRTVEQEWDAATRENDPDRVQRYWREETQGDDSVRVALTQDYDPIGEVSGGGYWIHVSRDRGASWRAIYTGLRDRLPYLVRRESRLPILAGDTVRLEVAIDEIDPRSITFPPIGLESTRRREGLFVSATLAELLRDGDEDGVTDLAENALLTNPADPDTDGDAIPDAQDRLPHVPKRSSDDHDRSAALAPALRMMFGESLRARVISVDTGAAPESEAGLRYAAGSPAAFGAHSALFVVGRRSDFAALEADQSIVVLSPREAATVSRSRSVFYPAWISLFVLDHERKRGVIVWSASWVGGRIRLTRSESGWEATVTSSWIT